MSHSILRVLASPLLRWTMTCAVLFLSSTASAQVSRISLESVAGEHIEVSLGEDETLRGYIRALTDDRVILLTDDGEVRELQIDRLTRLRIAGHAPAADPRVDDGPAAVDSSSREATGGYLSPTLPLRNERVDQGVPPDSDVRLYLELDDYRRYRAMRSSSRVKRIVGWSMAAVGATFFVSAIAQRSRAEAWGHPYDNSSEILSGFLLSGIGVPVAVIGRRQYRAASTFAQDAAVGRQAVADDATAPTPVLSE